MSIGETDLTQVAQGTGNYTLWLLPCEEDEAWMRKLIVELSAELGTPAFFPHATLIGGLSETGDAAQAELDRLAKAHAALDVRISEIGMQSQIFTAFFLRLELPADLAELHSASLGFGAGSIYPQSDFMPHVSLAYGEIDDRVKHELKARLSSEVTERKVRFDRLAYSYSGKGAPVSQWRIDLCSELG